MKIYFKRLYTLKPLQTLKMLKQSESFIKSLHRENTKEFVIKKLSSDSCVREKSLVCDSP